MNKLIKTILTSSILLCCGFSLAGTRSFTLEFAVLNPAMATVNPSTNLEQDSRAPDSGFTASGTLVIRDDSAPKEIEVDRSLRLCNQKGCVNNNETFVIPGYGYNIGPKGDLYSVFMTRKNDHSMRYASLSMGVFWNYINLGLIEPLKSSWGTGGVNWMHFDSNLLLMSWRPN